MTPRKSFLLLVLGLDMLAWIFPVRWIAAIFGFVTIWAVMGFRWGIAVALFASIPDWISGAFYLYQMAAPILPKWNHAFDVCHSVLNQTLRASCFNSQLNNIQSLPKVQIASIPKPPFTLNVWQALSVAVPAECFVFYLLVRKVLKIKNRIRQSIGHIYGFRKPKSES